MHRVTNRPFVALLLLHVPALAHEGSPDGLRLWIAIRRSMTGVPTPWLVPPLAVEAQPGGEDLLASVPG